MPKVVGIDLGTTNSCVAVMEGGKPVVIPNAEGVRTTPSTVAINKHGVRLVGEVAQRHAITNPENTISSIMRFVGRKYDDPDVDRDRRLVPYKVVRASNGDAWVEVQGKHYSLPEILAMILQKLKMDAESYLGEQVTQTVMTVPCFFDGVQRQAIKDAGRIAGLEVLRLLRHSTAAALAYGRDKKKDERIGVYDLGGGTFDISILELGDGVFEVKSYNGDIHLGGDDFDQRIIDWLADEFRKENGIDLRQDRMALQRLKEAAEKTKKELSSSMQTEINLSFIMTDASGPKHLNMALSRSKLEQLVEDLIEKSRGPVMKALADAGVGPDDIREVVLVGGQTRMPAVHAMVQGIFNREPNRGVNPDEVVAIGAAIQAGVLMGDVKDVLLLDVISHSLGIETPGGVSTKLIERNTTIPTQKSQVFSTYTDNAPSFEVNILEGERKFARDNRSLGSFILDGIPPAPRGVPQIEVTFDIDWDENLTVSARDKGTGREVKAYTSEDKRRQEEAVERNLAESAAYRAEKGIAELGDKLTPEQKRELASKITDVRAVLAASNIAHIKSARGALELAFHEISEAIRQDQEQRRFFTEQQIGHYYLLKKLGQGGFATVYLGKHRYLQTLAAIKVLHMHIQGDACQSFLQEAQAIAHLRHHHIVRVLDFGVENATPFLVMDYAPGGSLRDRHPVGRRLSPTTILSYVRQIASALYYAHQQKIVHRDVKPENVLLESDGTVLLSDFGIAVQAHQTDSLSEQQASGTAGYMAPEHIQGKARPASDQYALAVVIYEWLCGRRPFVGKSFMEVVLQHLQNSPPPLRAFAPELPLAVEQVVLTALAKDPKQRFATVQAFAMAFENACQ